MSSKDYGHFSPDGAEYIVTRPDTPRPWINYLTNGEYCALCSHLGGGFSFFLDQHRHSILRRGAFLHLEDMPARLLYLKDEASGEIWTANVQPLGKVERFSARHGMFYTVVQSQYSGIETTLKFFVPTGLNAELWEVSVVNRGRRTRALSLYACAELVLGNTSLEDHEPQIAALFNAVEQSPRALIFRKHMWHAHWLWFEDSTTWPYRVYMTATRAPARMLADRNAFFGPYRSYANPAALEQKFLPDAIGSGKNLVGAFQWRVKLAPGRSWSACVSIGIQPNVDSAANRHEIRSLQSNATCAAAWKRTQRHWNRLLSPLTVRTPDEDINQLANFWTKHQLLQNFYFGRGPSYYHKGQIPAVRDSCQDVFGVTPLNSALAEESLRRIGAFFFRDGRATGGCNRLGLPEGPSIKVDLPLWFVLAVLDYVKNTGAFAFLDEPLPLQDGGASTVYEKMLAGVDRMLQGRGRHGLPLIGRGDWNDAANGIGSGGKGESVWLGQFLYFVLRQLEPLLARRGETARLKRYRARAAELKRIVNERCWDGEWFVRAFRDNGKPVGVRGQKEACLWINSQTWAVIADISDPRRLNMCLDSVERHLGTPQGLMNLAPAYTRQDDSVGLITHFRPGWKENAAVFSHASAFNVVARAMLNRGTDALDLYRRLLPTRKNPNVYLMEPYVYSQFCAGPGAGPEAGRGAYHWLTGTAAWMFRALTDYILGVHPEFDGLRIWPVVDPAWRSFSLTRPFRGAQYAIEFSNPEGVECGVKEVRLDGELIAGPMLPLPTRKRHKVQVLMGKV